MTLTHQDRDWLYDRYVIDGMKTAEIAKLWGTTSKRVCARLSKFGIPNRRAPVSKETYDAIQITYNIADEKNTFVDLDELSKRLKYSKTTICRCARQLGMTDKNRPKRFVERSKSASPQDVGWSYAKIVFLIDNYESMTYPELKKHIGFAEGATHRMLDELGLQKSDSDRWKHRPHPRGMLGKHHTPDICAGMSARMIRYWQDPESNYNSEEFRQKRSDYMTQQRATCPTTNVYSRTRSGKRSDLDDLFVRSSWEANFARYLNFLITTDYIFRWEYEPDRFDFIEIKRGTRSYMPDFKVWDTKDSIPYYYEIKGWMDAKSKTRLKRMAKYYPDIKVIVFGAKEYRDLTKKVSGIIPNWEV